MSTRAGSRRSLVPGSPAAVLVCRYRGPNQRLPAFRLQSHRLVSKPATVARLAQKLDALKVTKGELTCPFASGSAIVAWFRYPSGAPDPVSVALDGCLLVSDGHVHRVAGVQSGGSALVAALESLVPVPAP